MSASEFGSWLAFLREEPIGPRDALDRWAVLVAAVNNGGLRRRDKRNWQASDFLPPLWVQPVEQAAPMSKDDELKALRAMAGIGKAVRKR